ncbi:alginate lyase family protein [Litoribrevibacter euphylliae]|uniref:Alginate lyase family protein n=1 Tax=Litoribrevibacter euphylliae TaxID=1834034 RepID=A0ABV7HNR9_9GAMM
MKIKILFFVIYSLLAGYTYANTVCPHTPTDAYQGHLSIMSKYDPNDPTRSQPSTPDPESELIQEHLNKFAFYISRISDYYVSSSDTRKQQIALNCMDIWLELWASRNALETSDISHTGYAVRSWFISTIASSIFKTQQQSDHSWEPSANAQGWIRQLMYDNISYYYPRTFTSQEKVNNHDYWAAWAAAATGLVTSDRDLTDWAYSVLVFSLDQAEKDPTTDTAYFPNEIGRGQLSSFYSHFALTPIVMLASTLPDKGYTLHQEQHQKLTQLSEFTSAFTLTPSRFAHLNSIPQNNFSGSALYWSKIHNIKFTNSQSTILLEDKYSNIINPMPQIGGNIISTFE